MQTIWSAHRQRLVMRAAISWREQATVAGARAHSPVHAARRFKESCTVAASVVSARFGGAAGEVGATIP
jgi:hypothetical protein